MSVWDELTGQSEAIEVFRAAAASAAPASASREASSRASASRSTSTPVASAPFAGAPAAGAPAAVASKGEAPSASNDAAASHGAMTHSWLITGPPGSGRSNLAYAFASALLCRNGGCGVCADCRQVAARTHPDLAVLSTDRVIISIEEVRTLVASSQFSPSVSRYRVMVIEDADRMAERTSNVLLKALEEPPERTVWILCAPSEADLLPTIRSRVRSVRLRIPSTDDVARLLERRDGVDTATAERAAREAQSHIGMAHRLATNHEARARRDETLKVALGIRSVPGAVLAAARLLELAKADAEAITEERDAEERESTLRSLGVEPGQAVPMGLRSQVKTLEEDQKRRATRSLRDGIDRILVDLLSLYRDILLRQLESTLEPINLAIHSEIEAAARDTEPAQTLAIMDSIAVARTRISRNVTPALSLEAMLITVALPSAPRKAQL
ncbi:DNA polymerase III subunit delta' [Subtercola sp. PAMC28395]|uniref:DNA polymerase III subunit delta' n=1 Tax=Subtercola sp. PAMC28395 TaxID=2846775 RepID=UPI001C0BA211|nr:DNA polymerase III subunit delta' [Subtercola sp. PAMC28395]QWT24923.1 DNA polymerase III subunit delta' [Subtercola sp. PAMC28395]